MSGNWAVVFATGIALSWASAASGFRNCDIEDSDAWSAVTSYTVGELSFDDTTGLASGTETIYNYSNTDPVGECHVTYELTGNYVPGVDVFVLDATRSNFSQACPPEMLGIAFPATLLHTFRMEHGEDGTAELISGDSGDYLADGSWQAGSAVYKTGEKCSMF